MTDRALCRSPRNNHSSQRQRATTPSSTGERWRPTARFRFRWAKRFGSSWLSLAPPLILMLVVGLIISMIQAATSINEQTVSFVPKLLAFILFVALYGVTVGDLLIDYTRDLLIHIPDDIR
ncbi:MAG: flagellar biosynthetic protein FliQ [Pseudomonadota bacterium]